MADPTTSQPNDFQLRPVQNTPPVPAPSLAAPPGDARSNTLDIPPAMQLDTGMSSNDVVIALAIILVLGIVFFFVRGGIRRHLISERASLSAASTAGWALFAFLMSVTVMVVFGVIGNVFRLIAFVAPMSLLVLATLIIAVVTYRGATRRRR